MPALTDLDVDWVSLVDRAAVRDAADPSEPARFLLWKAESPPTLRPGHERITKASGMLVTKSDQRLVYGVVLQPGVPDSQGDTLTASEIEKAAHRYLVQSRKVDLLHSESQAPVQVVESGIAPCDTQIGGRPVLKGSWVMASRINDDAIWAAIQDGELTGYSIGGSAARKAEHQQSTTEDTTMGDQALQGKITQLEADNADLKRQLGTAGVEKSSYSWDEAVERAAELQKSDHTLSRPDAINRVFKADRDLQARYADEQMRGVASRPVAPPPAPVAKAEPVYEELVKRANELRERDPKLSLGEAQTAVMKSDRGLQDRFIAERNGRA